MRSAMRGVWCVRGMMNCGHLFLRARLDRWTNQDRHDPADDNPQKKNDKSHREYHLCLREDSAAAEARAKWYRGFNLAGPLVLGPRFSELGSDASGHWEQTESGMGRSSVRMPAIFVYGLRQKKTRCAEPLAVAERTSAHTEAVVANLRGHFE